jgi:hypothetical protein
MSAEVNYPYAAHSWRKLILSCPKESSFLVFMNSRLVSDLLRSLSHRYDFSRPQKSVLGTKILSLIYADTPTRSTANMAGLIFLI